jgi:hypothetical protein
MESTSVTQTGIQPRQGVVTLFGYGTSVRVDRGHLIPKTGSGLIVAKHAFPESDMVCGA